MLEKNAFIGASLGSRLFTREWVRGAYEQILRRHDRLLVVIADELWLYTRMFGVADDWSPTFAIARMEQIRDEMTRLFEWARAALPKADSNRIDIASWSRYSDADYARLLRTLRSAAAYLKGFSSSVDVAVKHHVSKVEIEGSAVGTRAASRDYIVDEIAMCLRVTELAGFSAEYYPGNDLSVLRELYAGRFAVEGLTIESLIGRSGHRVFTNLKLPAPKTPAAYRKVHVD